jgi:hypothetical protein
VSDNVVTRRDEHPRPEDMPRRSLELEVVRSRVTIAQLMISTAISERDQVLWSQRYNEAWAECRRVETSEATHG